MIKAWVNKKIERVKLFFRWQWNAFLYNNGLGPSPALQEFRRLAAKHGFKEVTGKK